MTSTPDCLFGTDGIRDVANRGMLTPERLLRLGAVTGRLLLSRPGIFHSPRVRRLPSHLRRRGRDGRSGAPWVLIGRDPRRSGPLLERALSAGLLGAGIDVAFADVLPTPAIAHLTRVRGAALGCVLSASHNPMADNGIKFFSPEGLKIPDAAERAIETECARRPAEDRPGPIGSGVGVVREIADARSGYEAALLAQVPRLSLRGWTIVLDCANGATSAVAPELLRRLGARVIATSAEPDGVNINDRCGAVHPERLAVEVQRRRATLGLAFDGDGDRLIAVDERGGIVDGDPLLAILARRLKRRGRLAGRTVVGTVMTNLGLERSLAEIGVRLLRTAVGDRTIAEACLDKGYVLGGEPSGHLLFFDRATTGDGLLTALLLLEAMREGRQPLSRLAACMTRCPQILKNIPVREKPPLARIRGYPAALKRAEAELGDRGRILVRYSGTESLARVMVEGAELGEITATANRLASVIGAAIGGKPGHHA